MSEVGIDTVREAHARIRERIRWTPVMTSARLDEFSGARLFFKCENFQETGSFKARGAANAVLSLTDDEAARGVATHSSGNPDKSRFLMPLIYCCNAFPNMRYSLGALGSTAILETVSKYFCASEP